jgi:predicted N-formylglutamate amidohydrolase
MRDNDAGESATEPSSAASPFVVIDGDATGGIILLCDHASNAVPQSYARLGLPDDEFRRHIAYDIGAADVTRGLAERLRAPAILSTFSRLLIDANRGEDDPTLIMRLSDGAVVPGNAHVDAGERARRIALFHAPYHAAIDAAIDRSLAAGSVPMLVSLHSFTPVWRGTARSWHAGILSDRDRRLAEALIAGLSADPALHVGDNEPYRGALANDCLYRHGTGRGLAHALIEIRQDLIGDEAGVAGWVARLSPILAEANRHPELHVVRHFGSLTDTVAPGANSAVRRSGRSGQE